MDDYQQIPSRFDFAGLYDGITARAGDGSVFVEVGASLGCSALYLASRIKQSGKKICLYVVDWWDNDVFRQFIREVCRTGAEDIIFPWKMSSEQAAGLFEDGTLDFVFLAADPHESVRGNLEAWFPKVKRRGVIGGQDYLNADFPGVRRAVDAFFAEQELPLQLHGTSFLAIKPSSRWLNAGQRVYRRWLRN